MTTADTAHAGRRNARRGKTAIIGWVAVALAVPALGGAGAAHASPQMIPANDTFPGLAINGPASTISGSNVDSTGQPGEPAIAGSLPDRTVWYSWTAPGNGPTTINLRDAAFDTTLAVFTGNAVGSLTAVASNNNANGTLQSKLTFTAAQGTTYRIVVDGAAAATGPFGLQWSQNPPANDDFANSTTLPGNSGSVAASNVRATGEPGEPYHVGIQTTASVWYRWTPTVSGPAKVAVANLSEGLITHTVVYTGNAVNALTYYDDGEIVASFSAVAGTEYRIAVDGVDNTTGSFTLEYVLGVCNGLPATDFARGTFSGTPGNDVIVGSPIADTIDGGGGNDTICALGADDKIAGGMGADREFGGTGKDTFRQETTANGADRLDGEAGIDNVTYPRTAAVNVTMNNVANDGVAGEGDNVTPNVENVIGGSGADNLTGSGVANVMTGGAGNDTIRGGGGNDTLVGGTGADALFGEAGMDALNLADGAGGDNGDGGSDVDTAVQDAGDTVVNVP